MWSSTRLTKIHTHSFCECCPCRQACDMDKDCSCKPTGRALVRRPCSMRCPMLSATQSLHSSLQPKSGRQRGLVAPTPCRAWDSNPAMLLHKHNGLVVPLQLDQQLLSQKEPVPIVPPRADAT